MKRLLLAAVVCIGLYAAGHGSAKAYVCAVPNLFRPGQVASAQQMNANNAALVQCLRNLDGRNFSSIFASDFKPTTVAQAAFGGAIAYTFNHGLAFLGLGPGCMAIDITSAVGTNGVDCSSGIVTIPHGGTNSAGPWTAGKCFWYSGGIFKQRGCGAFAVSASLPIQVSVTPPPTPTPGPTPTASPAAASAMVERQTTITRFRNCPNAQGISLAGGGGGGACSPDLWPQLFWSTKIIYRFYSTSDGGATWNFVSSDYFTDSDTETPSDGSGPPGPDCDGEGAGMAFVYCSGTWTPSVPASTAGMDFSAPFGAPGQTPGPSPTPSPTPAPTPIPTPTAQPTPPWHATLSMNTPLPMIYGGTGVDGQAWSQPLLLPFGDCLGTSAGRGVVTWQPCLGAFKANVSFQNAQIADGAVHVYPLSETTGSANATDVGAVPQTLPYNGTVTPGTGPSLWALSPRSPTFNVGKVGTNSFLYNPNASHFSVEAVIKQSSTPANTCGQIVGNDYDWTSFGHCSDARSVFHGFALRVGDHYNGFTVCNGSACFTAAGPVYTAGTIYYVVGVFTGSAVQLYVNGSLFSSTAFTGTYQNSTSVPWTIGDDQNNNSQFAFLGNLSNVATYDTALSAGQVAQHQADLAGSGGSLACVHSPGPWCATIVSAPFVWTDVPIAFSSCAAVTTRSTTGNCASVNLFTPANPNPAFASYFSPYAGVGLIESCTVNHSDGSYPLRYGFSESTSGGQHVILKAWNPSPAAISSYSGSVDVACYGTLSTNALF